MARYLKQLSDCFSTIEVENAKAKAIPLEKAVAKVAALITEAARRGNKVMIVGNGGSAAIASHMVIDLVRNAQIPAVAFNDASSLTCLANDLGYDAVFATPIATLSRTGDVLIAISSSGRSVNILKAADVAKKQKCHVVTLSGFTGTNPLRKSGDINFYLPSSSYGFVELTHSAICHWITDTIMHQRAHG